MKALLVKYKSSSKQKVIKEIATTSSKSAFKLLKFDIEDLGNCYKDEAELVDIIKKDKKIKKFLKAVDIDKIIDAEDVHSIAEILAYRDCEGKQKFYILGTYDSVKDKLKYEFKRRKEEVKQYEQCENN